MLKHPEDTATKDSHWFAEQQNIFSNIYMSTRNKTDSENALTVCQTGTIKTALS